MKTNIITLFASLTTAADWGRTCTDEYIDQNDTLTATCGIGMFLTSLLGQSFCFSKRDEQVVDIGEGDNQGGVMTTSLDLNTCLGFSGEGIEVCSLFQVQGRGRVR